MDNKYANWYFNIIENARTKHRAKFNGTYFESHHILPKSLKGGNGRANLVLLTPKEHFICHCLLTRMTTGSDRIKMFRALCGMRGKGKGCTSRVYHCAREELHRASVVPPPQESPKPRPAHVRPRSKPRRWKYHARNRKPRSVDYVAARVALACSKAKSGLQARKKSRSAHNLPA